MIKLYPYTIEEKNIITSKLEKRKLEEDFLRKIKFGQYSDIKIISKDIKPFNQNKK